MTMQKHNPLLLVKLKRFSLTCLMETVCVSDAGFVGVLDRHVHASPSMNFFYLSPDDRNWLKRWLTKHASLLLLILCFWLILNAWPKAETPHSILNGQAEKRTNGDVFVASKAPVGVSHDSNQGYAMAWVGDGPQGIRRVDLPVSLVGAVGPGSARPDSTMNVASPMSSVPAVQPEGWRRTRDGWENTATWRTSVTSLGDIVRQQQVREPSWFQNLLARVRGVPPWGVALFQLAAVVGILIFERWMARQHHQTLSAIQKEA